MRALSSAFLAVPFTAIVSLSTSSSLVSRQSACTSDSEIDDFTLVATTSAGVEESLVVDFTSLDDSFVLAVCEKIAAFR